MLLCMCMLFEYARVASCEFVDNVKHLGSGDDLDNAWETGKLVRKGGGSHRYQGYNSIPSRHLTTSLPSSLASTARAHTPSMMSQKPLTSKPRPATTTGGAKPRTKFSPRAPASTPDRLKKLHAGLVDQINEGYLENAIKTCRKSESLASAAPARLGSTGWDTADRSI